MKDREIIGRMMGGGYALHFKACGHTMELPLVYVNQFESEHDLMVAIERVECMHCNQEFKKMEDQLNAEFKRLMENGGLK